MTVEIPSATKKFKELHGLTRSLIANMIEGVCNGYSKELSLVGVGYTADAKGSYLLLNLGYSHPIYFEKPDLITFETPSAMDEMSTHLILILLSPGIKIFLLNLEIFFFKIILFGIEL